MRRYEKKNPVIFLTIGKTTLKIEKQIQCEEGGHWNEQKYDLVEDAYNATITTDPFPLYRGEDAEKPYTTQNGNFPVLKIAPLEEKGYDPIAQLSGYITSGDPSYITSHNNARSLIKHVDRDDLVEELLRNFLEITKEK